MQLCVCLNLYAIKNIFWPNSLNLVSYKLIDSPQWIDPDLTGDIASLWNHNVWKPVPTTAICLYYLNHIAGSWGSGCPRQPLYLLSCYPWCWIFTVQEGKSKLLRRVTLCDHMDYPVHGILQARILECVAVPFCRGSSQTRDRTQVSNISGYFFTSWTTREGIFF